MEHFWISLFCGFVNRHWKTEFQAFSWHYINGNVVEKTVGIDGAKQGIHALPVAVKILAIEDRIEVADSIERRSRRTALNETVRAEDFADQRQSVAVIFDQVDVSVVQLGAVDDRGVEGECVFTIELVIVETNSSSERNIF